MSEAKKPTRIIATHDWREDKRQFRVIVSSEAPISKREALEVLLIKARQLLVEMDEDAPDAPKGGTP